MKRSTKTWAVIAAALMLLTVFPVTALAGETTGSLGGDSTVNDVTITVTVPANLNFALDPLELDSLSGSQVSTADYFFVNKTEAPVKVAMNITATLATGVTLVDSPTLLAKDDPGVTDKKLYFAALGATGVTANSLDFDYNFLTPAEGETAPAGTYSISAATKVPFNATDKKATIMFALGAATDAKKVTPGENEGDPDVISDGQDGIMDTLAASNKGVATFQFFGELNTYAAWDDSDVKVTGAYTLTALRATTYSNYTENSSYVANSLNQLKTVIGFTDATGTLFNSKEYTYSKSSVPSGGVSVGFSLAGKEITSFKGPDNADLVLDTDYSLDTDAIVLEPALLNKLTTGAKDLTIVVDGTTYTLNITPTYDAVGFLDAGGTATASKIYTFDSTAVPADGITVGFYFGGKTITSFTDADDAALVENTDYAVSGDSIVLKAALLNKLEVGEQDLTLVSDSKTYTLNLTVTAPIGFNDEGSVSLTESKDYTYDQADSGDVTVGFHFGGKSITSFKDAEDAALVADTDYTVTAESITLKAALLDAMAAGDNALTLVVDGTTYTLNVAVTAPIGFIDEGSVSLTESKDYTYDQAHSGDVTVGFHFGGKSITSFKDAGNTALDVDTDYTVTAESITLKAALLDAMSAGDQALTLVVDGTTYTLNVVVTAAAPTYTTAGFIVNSAIQTTQLSIGDVSKSQVGATVNIPFYFNGKSVTSLTINDTTRELGTAYTVGQQSITLTNSLITGFSSNGTKTVKIYLQGVTDPFIATFNLVA